MTEKDNNDENVIKKAGKFFSKKLDEQYVIDDDFNNEKFRTLGSCDRFRNPCPA